VFQIRQYVETVGLGNGEKACRVAVSLLHDDAFAWWRMYAMTHDDPANG
jgi:hypothetical protein